SSARVSAVKASRNLSFSSGAARLPSPASIRGGALGMVLRKTCSFMGGARIVSPLPSLAAPISAAAAADAISIEIIIALASSFKVKLPQNRRGGSRSVNVVQIVFLENQ